MTRRRRTDSGVSECAAVRPDQPSGPPIPTGASDAGGIPEGRSADLLCTIWKEAAEAHLQAECGHVNGMDAVERALEFLPGAGPAPEGPDPLDYAAAGTQAAFARLDVDREEIERKARELRARAEREAEANPDFREALATHGKALEAWYAAELLERRRERDAAEIHGVEDARRAEQEARHRMGEAGRQLLTAPVHSQADVLTILCVLLYMADLDYGIFEDEAKCLGVDPAALLRRLAPFLPFSPSAAPLG